MLYILTLIDEEGKILDQEIFSSSPTRDALIDISDCSRWELRSGDINGGDTILQTSSEIWGG